MQSIQSLITWFCADFYFAPIQTLARKCEFDGQLLAGELIIEIERVSHD